MENDPHEVPVFCLDDNSPSAEAEDWVSFDSPLAYFEDRCLAIVSEHEHTYTKSRDESNIDHHHYSGVVVSPEHLVFGESSPSSSGDDKRRRNAEAASRSRIKKKVREQSSSARFDELQQTQIRLQTENESLTALNRALESQLSFFRDLFRTTMQQSAAPICLPTHNDAHIIKNGDLLDSSDGGLELLPSSNKRKYLAQAVVLLAVFTVGSKDVINCGAGALLPGNSAALVSSHGRTLLWLDEVSTEQNCSTLPHISLWSILHPASPFSSAATFTCVVVLHSCAAIWLALMILSSLAPHLSQAWPRRISWRKSWCKSWCNNAASILLCRNVYKSHCQ